VEDVADLARGERPVVALQDDAQQLGRGEGLEGVGRLQLAPQNVVGLERLEELGRGLEADHQPLVAFEVDLEALQAQVRVDDPADPLAFHGHDRADVEGEQALELLDLLPGLGDVVRGALEADGVGEPLEDRTVGVEALQGGEDGGVELLGREEDRAGALQHFSAQIPAPGLAELVVEHLQQEAGALLLAGAGQGARHADEVVQIQGVLTHGGQPLSLDRIELPFGEVRLRVS
jgi:hypothetical protein